MVSVKRRKVTIFVRKWVRSLSVLNNCEFFHLIPVKKSGNTKYIAGSMDGNYNSSIFVISDLTST